MANDCTPVPEYSGATVAIVGLTSSCIVSDPGFIGYYGDRRLCVVSRKRLIEVSGHVSKSITETPIPSSSNLSPVLHHHRHSFIRSFSLFLVALAQVLRYVSYIQLQSITWPRLICPHFHEPSCFLPRPSFYTRDFNTLSFPLLSFLLI